MKHDIAETTNIQGLLYGLSELENRKERIAVVSGVSGLGKTTAMIYTQNQSNAVIVAASPLWTASWMLAGLCDALGLRRHNQAQPMFEQVVKMLKDTHRPIFIDESNFIVETLEARKILSILGTLYLLHDAAEIPIVMFGLSSFPRYLKDRASRNETVQAFVQRIVLWDEFKPCSIADAKAVAQKRCEVVIEDDLIVAIVSRIGGSYRKLLVELTDIERFALSNGLKSIGNSQFKDRRRA